MTREIPLTQGYVALVDDDDYPLVSSFNWRLMQANGKFYARSGKRRLLHRLLMNPPDGKVVDHINGDGLDCRRNNMRIASHSQNHANEALSKNNTSGFKGVSRHRDGGWMARLCCAGHAKSYIGYFATAEQAALAYDAKALELFGEFAKLNFPEVCQ